MPFWQNFKPQYLSFGAGSPQFKNMVKQHGEWGSFPSKGAKWKLGQNCKFINHFAQKWLVNFF